MRRVLLPRRMILSAYLGLCLLAPSAWADETGAQMRGALMLVRYTLLALDQAIKSGNYAVLRDLGAPEFRAANSAAKLAQIFAPHKRAGLDLAGASILEPLWTTGTIANGTLHLAGAFPSERLSTQFDLQFQAAGQGWRLASISVTTQPVSTKPLASAAAPVTPAASPEIETLALRR